MAMGIETAHEDAEATPNTMPVLETIRSHSMMHRSGGEKPSVGNENGGDGEDELEYPEGGLEAWMVVLGSCLAMIPSFGLLNTVGSFQPHLLEGNLSNYSADTVGWIFGVFSFLCFFCGIQIGPIFDKYGPRWLLFSGSICLVVGLMLFSVSKYYWQYMLTFGVLSGLGASLIFTPAVATVGHWFNKRRGYATGVASLGGSLGGIMFPLIIQGASPKIGFPWAVRIIGFVSIGFLTVGNMLCKSRPEIYRSRSSSRSSSTAADANSITTSKSKIERGAKIDLSSFKDPRFTLTVLGVFFTEWALFVPISYITSYALHLGLPYALSYQLLAFLNVGSVFGRWLPGLLADRFGRFNVMIGTVALCMAACLAFWLPSAYIAGLAGRKAIITVYVLVFGFASGSGISVTPVCVGQICTTEEYGTKFGTCYFFVSFGTLTGIPIAGAILKADNGSYLGLIIFVSVVYLAAIASFSAAKYVGTKGKWLSRW